MTGSARALLGVGFLLLLGALGLYYANDFFEGSRRTESAIHEIEGPLELLGLQGNIVPGESDLLDCHFHIMMSKS